MRVSLLTYDSRGRVGPLVGLAVRTRELSAGVQVCAPPDCAERLAEVGVPLVTTGLMPAAAGARSVAEKLGIRSVYVSYCHRGDPRRLLCRRQGQPAVLFGRVAAVVHHGGAGRGDAAATRPAEKGRQRGDLSKISLVARGGWPQSVSESPSP